MPELPEVEITRRKLAPKLVGRSIRDVLTTPKSYFFLTSPKLLGERLPGRRVTALARHGKYLIASLDDGASLLLHLGMTGQLFFSDVRQLAVARRAGPLTLSKRDPHAHLTLSFRDQGPALVFRDVRKFGKCALLPPGARNARLTKLGPDALGVTGQLLFEGSRKRRTPIKSLLLDQAVLAGVGNIYADEALFLAGISPRRAASKLTQAQADVLANRVRRVLEKAIKAGGSSMSDFVHPDGSAGGYQNRRYVYGREGEGCRTCKTPILRIVIGQRSSHYCPHCQL
jgi:formamidopyrimidine-DNA glycosylase